MKKLTKGRTPHTKVWGIISEKYPRLQSGVSLLFFIIFCLLLTNLVFAMGHPPKKEPQYKLEVLKVEIIPASPTPKNKP